MDLDISSIDYSRPYQPECRAMHHLEKEVRAYLRASEILIALLKTGKVLSADDTQYIETYTIRIRSLLKLSETIEPGTDSHITVRLRRDRSSPVE